MAELTFRPATLDDATFVSDVDTAARPHRPADPVVLRYWWEHPSDTWSEERYVVERGGSPVGYALMDHPHWGLAADRRANVSAELMPDERTAERFDACLAAMEERAIDAGAQLLRVRADEKNEFRIAAILGRGFREDRRSRRWELDLAGRRATIIALIEASRARMRAEGIHLLTLADDPDPAKYAKVWRLSEEASDDIPTTLARVPESLDDYLRWYRSPDMREDRFWLARTGEDIVGVSVLAYPPVRGVVGTAWTATARAIRGRGVARALKCETLAQAIALGVPRVRTGNDAANAPILHLNETMGYRPIEGSIDFLRSV